MNNHSRVFGPNFLVGLGVVSSTLLVAIAGESLPLLLAGPVLLGVFGGLARWTVDHSEGQHSLAAALVTFLYAAGCGTMAALIAPGNLELIMPILGVGVWAIAVRKTWCWRNRVAR